MKIKTIKYFNVDAFCADTLTPLAMAASHCYGTLLISHRTLEDLRHYLIVQLTFVDLCGTGPDPDLDLSMRLYEFSFIMSNFCRCVAATKLIDDKILEANIFTGENFLICGIIPIEEPLTGLCVNYCECKGYEMGSKAS